MADLTPEERVLLGIADDADVELVEEKPAPPSTVGRAFAGSAPSFQEVTKTLLSEQPDFDPVSDKVELPQVKRWLGAAGIYRVDWTADLVSGVEGTWEEEERIVDARWEQALVRLDVNGLVYVARLGAESVSVFATEPSSRVQWELPEALPALFVPPPSLEELAGPREVAPWLSSSFMELVESGAAVDRVAAVGLLLRGWAPTSKEARAGDIQRMLRGEPGIAAAVETWVGGLGEDVTFRVAARAADHAQLLVQNAELVGEMYARSDELARAAAAGVLVGRDSLESVAVALRTVGAAERLDVVLRHVDDELQSHITALLDGGATFERAFGREQRVALAHTEPLPRWWLGAT
ncbi:MAG: hypothetical protein JJ863_38515 [Deltaproteobacteria bacterium]|nr:hypothetical protein [Deltaproteobacteria bacterium]